MMGEGFDISIIVCAYTLDRWDDLTDALRSLRQQTVAPKEIIVVVDHNPELLARVEATYDSVAVPLVVVPNKYTRGLSGARNSGLEVAGGAIVAFIDEDATASPDWLAQLMDAYDNPRVLGVGGSIHPMWLSRRPAWFPEEYNWVVGCTYRGMPGLRSAVRNLIGCNMSFRREVFARVGGFRTGIGRIGTHPVGCEETEFCIRVAQQWPDSLLIYEPRARVDHRVPTHRACWRYFRQRCYAEGLSKALVTNLVGAKDGLANEWGYTLHTLPNAVLRGLAEAVGQAKPSGMGRAAAIVAGLAVTTAGYLRGKALQRLQMLRSAGAFGSESADVAPKPW